MLTSGDTIGPPMPVTPEQVYVMLGPLVAAARGSTRRHDNLSTIDLSRAERAQANNNTTSPLDRQSAASGGRHQDNTVNAISSPATSSASSSSATVLGLPPLNSSTNQLIQNLLLQRADNDDDDGGGVHSPRPGYNESTAIDYLQHNFTQIGQDHFNYHQTSGGGGRGPFTSYEWLMIVTLVTIILISIVGNLLVCVAIFTDRRLRKLGNAFIVSLAIADLFVSFLVMTFALHNDLMEEWIFGAWFCDIWISFDIMCCTASILNLCAISLDRFIHIKDCLLYNQLMTRRVAISAVIMIWIISGLVSFVPITLGWHKPSSTSSLLIPNTSFPAHLDYLAAAAAAYEDEDLNGRRTSPQLPANFTGGGVGGSQGARDDYREGPAGGGGRERAKRAAAYAIKDPQIARKLNYLTASGDASRRRRQGPDEAIGSADTSTQRQRRRLDMTQVVGGGQDQSGRQEGRRERADDSENKQHAILMRANEMRRFDQPTTSRVATEAQAASEHEKEAKEKKSNLGDGKPQTPPPPPPTEQIKHLPRARRRRQLGPQAVASKLASSDYEEEDEPLGGGRAGQEQTNRHAHPRQRQPLDSHGTTWADNGRERANEPPRPPPPPRAQQPAGPGGSAPAQCMLTLTPTYAVISSTISFYIPCIIMLGLYSKLFACARRHVRNIKAISKAPQPIGVGGGGRANSANPLASTHNYNGARSAGASNNHISTSSGASNLTIRSSRAQAAGPLMPMVDRARRLIGGAGNRHKPTPDGCIRESTCGLDTAPDKRSPHAGGKLARLVGARARTWIKLRGGETANQNSTVRCAIGGGGGDGQPRRVGNNNRDRESVTTASSVGCQPQSPGGRLVLKSILSSQKQQHEQPPSATDQSQPPEHGTEDNTVTHSSVSATATATATAELEPFLATAGGGERKSVASTNALGVKLNMIGADTGAAGVAADGAARLQMHQNQQQQRQLHARIQHQQQQQPHLQPTKQQTSQLATHKAAITLGIIMGTFLLCWLPFFCLNIIKAFYADLIPAWLFRAFTWLGYANSALNPIIYGIHNSEFRNAFNRIFFKHLTLKNGRQYLNRRFSYDLRSHLNNPAATAQARRRANHNDANNNNNSQQSGSAIVAPLMSGAVTGENKNTAARPDQLVGLARGESHAQINRPPHALSNNLQHGATTSASKNERAQGQGRAGSLAMGSSLDPNQQQQCLNLLNCLQERGGGHTSTAPSASNTTVHRTSEDLSGVKVAGCATAEESPTEPLQRVQPQTVAIS